MDSDTRKKTRDTTQAFAGMNSQIRISESSDSEQHNGEDEETRRGRAGQGTQDKRHTPEDEVADTTAHQSFLIPSKLFSLVRQPIAKFLTAGLLLL